MFRIKMSLYDLEIEIESNVTYPDAISDLTNRATTSFITALMAVKESGVELFKLLEEEDEFDD
jgi:hypothetical protein